jgi:preprotein translocase subunit Sss1
MRRQRVGLGNDGDQVDPRPEALHDLDVERFQRVTRRPDKVQARVDAHVVLLPALGLLLLTHVGFVLVVLWRASVDARVRRSVLSLSVMGG